MKVTFSGNNHENQSLNSKPVVTTTTWTTTSPGNTAPTTSPYEPKSVLELYGSPIPVAKKAISNCTTAGISTIPDDPLQLGDLPLSHHFEDWDLGLDDDLIPVSKPASQLGTLCDQQYASIPEFTSVNSFDSLTQVEPTDFSPLSGIITTAPLSHNNNIIHPFELSGEIQNLNNNNLNVGFDYVDELIRLAECFDTNSLKVGQISLARLNQQLRSPTGKPRQRAAFYFKEALQSLLSRLTRQTRPASSSEIIQTIKAQKMFSGISPIPMFSSFTANQAVLEALEGCIHVNHVHIIDFDIGLGSQWASFLKELADKAESGKAIPALLRITAIVPEDYAMEARLISENLSQFARELNIRLDIDFVWISTFEYLSFKAIKLMDGENVAVLLSPAIFQHVGTGFLNDLRGISPLVVVHVGNEVQMGFEAPSYLQAVIDGLDFYSTLFESLEAANVNSGGGSGGGGGEDWIRKIETFVFLPKIMEAVEAAGCGRKPWREALVAAGLRQAGLSQFAEFQAVCLLRGAKVRGFHVEKQQEEMLLRWHNRPLVGTSAWRY